MVGALPYARAGRDRGVGAKRRSHTGTMNPTQPSPRSPTNHWWPLGTVVSTCGCRSPRKERQKMSPEAGICLTEHIAPRLKAAVPYIKPVGCEDKEELLQEGLCMAAHLLENNERQGKVVPVSSMAYYTILHLKSGCRSHSAARMDVMGSGTQLDGKTAVVSTETEIGWDPELNEPIRLGEFLPCGQDDPSVRASRNIDWDEFIDSQRLSAWCASEGHGRGKRCLGTVEGVGAEIFAGAGAQGADGGSSS